MKQTSETAAPQKKTALSVNLNKVALVRNTRHLGIPSVTKAAELCLRAGAQGITVHPRPDARHIRSEDVYDLHAMLKKDWPEVEFNIEGNPFQNLMAFIRELRPHQCTFVPDGEGQFTSDHGWDLAADADRLRPLIEEAQSLGVRVSLFMDPVAQAMQAARDVGADRVELYTESFASAYGTPFQDSVLRAFADAARAAQEAGLGVNAGHDLNLDNLTAFLQAAPQVQEVSIGHALIADALELGYAGAIKAYLASIDKAFSFVS
ncbi:MAG: pyridoxine 5'-phosphate synthase [Ramlibacter sp.]|nr:pyridoxine 5'-phosphate synthase [Ramlibacter sp.]